MDSIAILTALAEFFSAVGLDFLEFLWIHYTRKETGYFGQKGNKMYEVEQRFSQTFWQSKEQNVSWMEQATMTETEDI